MLRRCRRGGGSAPRRAARLRVGLGVRQGGVLSTHLFALYIDDLIKELRKLKNGCYIIDVFLACIVYADDICLLAPCRSALELLLNTCETYGLQWCLSYNPSKSKVMFFGKGTQSSPRNGATTVRGMASSSQTGRTPTWKGT